MDNKKWYKSRTVWSGMLKTIAGITTSLASLLSGEIDGQTFLLGLATAIWGIYDILIRFDTNKLIK